MRLRPAAASACAFAGSSEPFVVRVRSAPSGASMRDQPLEVAADERLAAREPELRDARRDEDRRDARDLLEGQQLLPVQESVVAAEDLLRHAVDAAEVAAVGDRDAQVAQRPAEGVEHVHGQTVAELCWNRSVMRALLVLVAVTAVWGVTFVQVKDAVAIYPLFAFLAVRFAIATSTLAVPAARRLPRARAARRARRRPRAAPCSRPATRSRRSGSSGRPSRAPASSPGCTSC